VEKELLVAVRAAQEAGAAILEVWSRSDFASQEKADGKGPLTEADLAADRILHEHLQSAFPDDAILSEETVDSQFVVSVGLAIDGKPAVGVLFNPATNELFTGIVGVGATYNGQPCQVSTLATLDGARLLVSATETKKGWFEHLRGVCETEPMGSVAYKFGLVAAGMADATFTPKPRNEWDLLGGAACILAAGGRTTNGAGEDYTFNRPDPLHIGVCGSNGALHDTILDLMRQRA
jgi:myo-inositol-1(or 4)-monophosphatase